MICRWRELRVACVCMSLASLPVTYLASIARWPQACGADDMFGNSHPVGKAALKAGVELGCWTIRDFFSKKDFECLKQRSQTSMSTAVRLHSPETFKDGGTYYRTLAASKRPCTCKYGSAGFNPERDVSKYGFWHPDGDDEFSRLCVDLLRPFADKFNIPIDMMPDLVVGNCYGEETEHIGEHTDTHKFFDGLNGNCVILSITHRTGRVVLRTPAFREERGLRVC